jgi:hypothetical protein
MAIQNPTVNYEWDLPVVGGSSGAWGTILNTLFGDDGANSLDSILADFEDRVSTVETALGVTPTEAVVNRFIDATGGVYSLPANILTGVLVNFTGSTTSGGVINIDLDAVLAAGGPEMDSADFMSYMVNAWRVSDKVVLESVLTGVGSGNSIDIYFRYRDGAVAASVSISGRIMLYFTAAPA